MNHKNNWGYLYFGLVGIIAFAMMLWITSYGSGVSPDSTAYFGIAKSLLLGKGLTINAHFPPLYPLLLALAALFENNLVQASRFLNAIVFGVNAGLIAFAVYSSTRHNVVISACAVLFFLSSAPLLEVHSYAWSEPLFITLSLTCIILLSMYSVKPTTFLLIASSLSLGFSMVTRYIGVGFLPAALIIVFVSKSGQHISRRFRSTLIWLILACVPLGFLLAKNTILAGTATDRVFVFHPISVTRYISVFISNIFYFFAPILLPTGMKIAIVGLLVAFLIVLLVILFKQHLTNLNWRSMEIMMPISSLLLSFSYFIFLFISVSFFDAATPIDNRILSPIFSILIVGIFPALLALSHILKKPIIWWGFLIFLALSISIKMPNAILSASAINKNGLGYSSRQWQESETVAFVKALPTGVKIYTNGRAVLGFLTEKQVIGIPRKTYSDTMLTNPYYDEEIKTMCKEIIENRALLVYLNQSAWRWYLPSQGEIELTCHLPVLQHFADGTVYGQK